MKKIRLRRWVKVVLEIIAYISGFMLLTVCEDNLQLLIKTIICMFVMLTSVTLLNVYGE